LLARLDEHVVYSLVLVVAAVVVALPLGLVIGHTGRGVAALAGIANGLRAIPSLGLLLFLIVLLSPRVHVTSGFTSLIARGSVPYLIPAMIVLVVVAVPPILTSTYAGVQSVDGDVRDAARGAGMSPLQVVAKVELPCALPLVKSGIRNATLEVIATLTVAAYAPLVGGLGRLIVDGDQNLSDPRYGYPAMVAAAITIAALALVADTLLAFVQRSIVSPGISGRYATNGPFKRSLIHNPFTSPPAVQARRPLKEEDDAHLHRADRARRRSHCGLCRRRQLIETGRAGRERDRIVAGEPAE